MANCEMEMERTEYHEKASSDRNLISRIFSRLKGQIGDSLPILISRVSHINVNSVIFQQYYGENE